MEAEARTEQQIIIREVTHIQPSWAERERGEPGAFTLQLAGAGLRNRGVHSSPYRGRRRGDTAAPGSHREGVLRPAAQGPDLRQYTGARARPVLEAYKTRRCGCPRHRARRLR